MRLNKSALHTTYENETHFDSFPSSRYSHSELFASSQRVQTGCLPSHFLFLHQLAPCHFFSNIDTPLSAVIAGLGGSLPLRRFHACLFCVSHWKSLPRGGCQAESAAGPPPPARGGRTFRRICRNKRPTLLSINDASVQTSNPATLDLFIQLSQQIKIIRNTIIYNSSKYLSLAC